MSDWFYRDWFYRDWFYRDIQILCRTRFSFGCASWNEKEFMASRDCKFHRKEDVRAPCSSHTKWSIPNRCSMLRCVSSAWMLPTDYKWYGISWRGGERMMWRRIKTNPRKLSGEQMLLSTCLHIHKVKQQLLCEQKMIKNFVEWNNRGVIKK